MSKNLLRKAVLTTALIMSTSLYSCLDGGGGGGDTTTSSSDSSQTGQLVDAPVANVDYITSSGISGQTDENGYFTYNVGDQITFKIGKVVIGSVQLDDPDP
ncbi:MAG: hypothetical protein GXO45_00645, partial [Aquificae bacterium]|nr:hypothetical protein [Aquificota bacterium]